MPRGYLKHRHKAVGRKKSRGGASKGRQHLSSKGCRCPQCMPPAKLPQITEDDLFSSYDDAIGLFDWDYDDYDDDYELQAENQVSDDARTFSDYLTLGENTGNQGPSNPTDEEESLSLVAVSDIDSSVSVTSFVDVSEACSFSFCDNDDESAFSLISDVPGDTGDDFVALESPGLGAADKAEASADITPGDNEAATDCGSSDGALQPKDEIDQALVCSICLDSKPLVKVMKKCWHPSACYDCLRHQYVTTAQESASNYPLRCFWPDCGRVLRDEQVKKFVETEDELEQHYGMESRAKELRRRLHTFKDVHECPHCACPNLVRPYRQTNTTETYDVDCTDCSKSFSVRKLPAEEILSVLAALGPSFANCPRCGAFITKDGGCDHMNCIICNCDFSFFKAAHSN